MALLLASFLSPQGVRIVAATTSYLPLGGEQVRADTIRFEVSKTSPDNEEDLEPKVADLRNPENLTTETTYDEKAHMYIVGN